MIILYIIFGSLLFTCAYFFVKYIINNSASSNITTTTFVPLTTQNINTTSAIKPITTQNINTTSTIKPITTQNINTTIKPITTTSQPKARKIFFQAGKGGQPTLVYNIWQAPGGAGGILINNQGPVSESGVSYTYPTGGPGGIGYGSGGGASDFCPNNYTCGGGGSGSPGFVYLVQDDILFTNDTLYTIQSNFLLYTFILMGGGACGTHSSPNTREYPRGGSCGQIIIKQIKGNFKGTQFDIKIGKGGIMKNIPTAEGFERWLSFSGENTTVSFILNGNKNDYIAYGAEPPNNKENILSQYTPLAVGGYYNSSDEISTPGGVIPETVIENMNSVNPNPTN